VLIAQAVFLLARGHKDRQTHTHKATDDTDHHILASSTVGVANEAIINFDHVTNADILFIQFLLESETLLG